MKKVKRDVYFIEELKINLWIFSVLGRITLNKFSGKNTNNVIYVINGLVLVQAILNIFLIIFNLKLERLDFNILDIKDEKGILEELNVKYLDIVELKKQIISNSIFMKAVGNENISTYERVFIEKRILEDDLDKNKKIFRALFLVRVALWKTKNIDNANVIFCMNYRAWSEDISNFAKRSSVSILWGWTIIDIKYQLLIKRIFLKLRSLFLVQKIKFSKLLFRDSKTNENVYGEAKINTLRPKEDTTQKKSPLIAVPFWGSLNLDKAELYSDLFFLQKSGLSGNNFLVIFGTAADPFDKAKDRELRQHKINAVGLNKESTQISSLPIIKNNLREDLYFLFKIAKLWTSSSSRVDCRWIELQSARYKNRFTYWKQFFEQFNVRLYINWYKHDAEHVAIAAAIKDIGGISMVYQRSYEDVPNVRLVTVSDIVFSFSKNKAKIEQENQSVIPYHVTVGYLGDYRFPLLYKPAQEIRTTLLKKGARFVVSYFDENSVDDARWCRGHEDMRIDYEFLLQKVLSQPWLGVIFKPKTPFNLRKRLGATCALLEKAEKTGRCIVLEGDGILKSNYPPALGALAADVAIHGDMHAGTAGIEAALAGVPTLLLDKSGWPDSKLYELGKNKIVFDDWESLWLCCEDFWRSNCKIENFGDWSHLLNDLDPFRDGRAAERTGTYLKWLVDGYNAGQSRENILSDAAQRYTEIWGHDKITSINC